MNKEKLSTLIENFGRAMYSLGQCEGLSEQADAYRAEKEMYAYIDKYFAQASKMEEDIRDVFPYAS